jgi:hypothetical protein
MLEEVRLEEVIDTLVRSALLVRSARDRGAE